MRRLPLPLAIVIALCASVVAASSAAAAPGSAQSPTTPARLAGVVGEGFTDTLVTGSVSQPISVTSIGDRRAVVLDKAGRVRVIDNGTLVNTSALSMTSEVCSNSERGMLGLATDPEFALNGFVYIYWTRYAASAPGGCVNRVSRFTMTGNTIARNSEVVLIDNIGSPAGNHNGGDLEVGNDGYLYVAVGDGGCHPRNPIPNSSADCAGGNTAAQDLSLLNGKILRIDRTTGAPAPGNPISGAGTVACGSRGNTPSTPSTWCRELFAWGLRNPWRFAFDPNTGATRFYINDVGQGAREEVNVGAAGANYGWPAREGFCAQGANTPCPGPDPGAGYTQPLTDYSHNDARTDFGGEYITGGAFVPDGAWPEEYDGGYIFADGNPGQIFHRPAVAPPNPLSVYSDPFVTGVLGVSDLGFVFESQGWVLYYVSPALGEVRRVAPTLSASPDPGSLRFVPVTPERVYDSRDAGADSGRLRAGTGRLVPVVDDRGDHRAAVVTLTYVRPVGTAYAVVWEPRTPRPPSSNINAQNNEVAANTSIVPIDADGNIVVYSSATSHVLVDVIGFFDVSGSTAAGRFEPVGPTRMVDTRNESSPENLYEESVDGNDRVVAFAVEGSFDVPAGTSAVALIVTALSAPGAPAGYLTAHPLGTAVPTTSNVNVSGNGDRRANLVIVPVGTGGSVSLSMRHVADVVVDVVGSFTGGSAAVSDDGLYRMIAPTREVDSRLSNPFPRLVAGGSGSDNPASVPDNALAVTQNLIVVNTGATGFSVAYPANLVTVPIVSNINASGSGQTRSAMAITRLSPTGGMTYYSSMAADLVVDTTGYFLSTAG